MLCGFPLELFGQGQDIGQHQVERVNLPLKPDHFAALSICQIKLGPAIQLLPVQRDALGLLGVVVNDTADIGIVKQVGPTRNILELLVLGLGTFEGGVADCDIGWPP